MFYRAVMFALIGLLAIKANADTFSQAWNGSTSDTWYEPAPYTAENTVHTFELTNVPNFGGYIGGDSFWYRVCKRLSPNSGWEDLEVGGQYWSGTFSKDVTVSPNNQVKFVIYSNKNKTDTDIAGVYLWSFRAPDTTGPTWGSGSVDLASEDDTGSSQSDNITYKTSKLTFSWPTATDAGVGMQEYQYKIDSNPWTSCGLKTSVDVSASEGTHKFYVRAIDKAGNPSSEKRLSFTVDTTAPSPVPSPVSPKDDVRITDKTPFFDWGKSSDSGGGIDDYEIFVERWNGVYWRDTSLASRRTGSTSSDYTTPSQDELAAGGSRYRWRVRAWDKAGNPSDWSQYGYFYIDDTSGLSVTLRNHNGVAAEAAKTRFYISGPDRPYSLVSSGMNPGVINDLTVGKSYEIEGHFENVTEGANEYWGTGLFEVAADFCRDVSITRKTPYVAELGIFRVKDNSRVGTNDKVNPGDELYAKVKIRNGDKTMPVKLELLRSASASGTGTSLGSLQILNCGITADGVDYRINFTAPTAGTVYYRIRVKATPGRASC